MIRFTMTLNATKADPDTYQTWFTVEFTGDANGTILCLGNAEGNGQVWNAIGTWDGPSKSLRFTDETCFATRVIATVMTRKGWNANDAKTFGAAYPLACAIDVTGSRLTAMPSLMAGRPPRDKNRSMRAENVTQLTGKAPHLAGGNVDAMQATILANQAQDKADKAAAKAMGKKIGEYRSLKAAGLV